MSLTASPEAAQRPSRNLLALGLLAATLVAAFVVAKAARDALFLSTFGTAALPRMMTASAVASMLAVLGVARLLGRTTPRRLLSAALLAASSLLVLEWWLAAAIPRVGSVLLHLHVAVFGASLLSVYWSMVNERFDPYTAKRVMGRIGAGAALGGVAGGGIAMAAARVLNVPAMVAVVALLTACALALLRVLPQPAAPAGEPRPPDDTRVDRWALVRVLREGPYLRHLAALMALGAVMESFLDYSMNALALSTIPRGAPLLAFFGAYQAGLSVLGLLAQAVLVRWSLQNLGLAGTVSTRAATVAASAVAGFFEPRLAVLVLARGSHAVLTSSLFRSGYELLFTPVPAEQKRVAKTVIDVGFDKLGSVVGALTTAAVVFLLPQEAVRALLALSVLAALLSLLLTKRLHAGYLATLKDSLRSGAARAGGDAEGSSVRLLETQAVEAGSGILRLDTLHLAGEPGVQDDALLGAIADLRSGARSRVLRVVGAARDPEPELVAFLVPLLADDTVAGEVLKALRRVAVRATGQLLDVLLDSSGDPRVRRRIPRVLVAAPTARAVAGLLQGLDDERFDVRSRCALALARLVERNPEIKPPREAVLAAALAELRREPASGDSGAGIPGSEEDLVAHVFRLLAVGLERDAVQMVEHALRSGERGRVGTALEYLQTVLGDDLRRALWDRLHLAALERREARPSNEVLEELLRSSVGQARRAPARKD